MKKPTPISVWKISIITSIVLLAVLIASNYYSLFTNKFHFNKIDSYLFAILTIVHFVYLYTVWYKLEQNEYPDKEMRNLEYCFYVVFVVYIYKIVDTANILFGHNTYNNFVLPQNFLPIGISIVITYLILCFLTLYIIFIRKNKIGNYATDCFSEEEIDN